MALPTPLTTIFTPPVECLTQVNYFPGYHIDIGPGTQCIPRGPNPTLRQAFSPGLYCPSGWTEACRTVITIGTATETRATCCPAMNSIPTWSRLSLTCRQDTIQFPWFASLGCGATFGSLASVAPYTAVVQDVLGSPATITTISVAQPADGLNAFSVQLAWQASDLSTQPLSTSATSSSSTISPLYPPSRPSIPASSGLSNAAKISMGVIIPVVVLAALFGGFLLGKRRRNSTKQNTMGLSHLRVEKGQQSGPMPPTYHQYQPVPVELAQGTQMFRVQETQGSPIHEMHAAATPERSR